MAGRTSKRCSWTSRAIGADRHSPRRRHSEGRGPVLLAAPRRRDDSAALVLAALVLAAADRADLLASGADVHVGIPATRRGAAIGRGYGGGEYLSRGVPVVGHLVPRPDRLLDVIHGGDVGAQSSQS